MLFLSKLDWFLEPMQNGFNPKTLNQQQIQMYYSAHSEIVLPNNQSMNTHSISVYKIWISVELSDRVPHPQSLFHQGDSSLESLVLVRDC